MPVTATVQVSFSGSSEGGLLTAELDSRPDGYNGGRTSFTTGDEPVILVRKSSNVTISTVLTSVGSCAPVGGGSTNEEDFLTFMNSKSATTSKPVSGGLVTQWYGANLGGIKLKDENEIVLTVAGAVEGAGVLGVSYRSDFIAYKLSGVPSKLNGKSSFNVLVAFIGTVVTP